MFNRYCFLMLAGILLCGCGREIHRAGISSPDNTIRLRVATDLDGAMHYIIYVSGTPFITASQLGLKAREVNLKDGFSIVSTSKQTNQDDWVQPWIATPEESVQQQEESTEPDGQSEQAAEQTEEIAPHNELAVALENLAGVKLTLRFRLFNDGLGFRYEYDTPVDSITLTDELTALRFAQQGEAWAIPADSAANAHPMVLPISSLSDARLPAMFHSRDISAVVDEVECDAFPPMHLRQLDSLAFKAELAPLPDGTKAQLGPSFQTPWRTIRITPSTEE